MRVGNLMYNKILEKLESIGVSENDLQGDSKVKKVLDLVRDLEGNSSGFQNCDTQAAVESIPGPVAWIDADFNYLECNSYLKERLDLGDEPVQNLQAGNQRFDSFLAPVLEGLRSSDRQSFNWETNILHNGEKVWLILSARRYYRGSDLCYFISGYEVSSLRMQQRLLLDIEERYRAAFQEVSVGICQLDGNFRIEHFNRRFCEFVNKAEDVLRGCSLQEVFGQNEGTRLHTVLNNLSVDSTSIRQSTELQILRFSENEPEKIWVRASIAKLPAKTGKPFYVAAFEDITEIKNAYVELEKSHKALRYSEKMAALGEMAGGLAHEINNPLAIIDGRAQILADRLSKIDNLSPQLVRSVESILETSKRISQIISSLRLFSKEKEETDTFEDFDICHLVTSTVLLCRERFKNSDILLDSDVPDRPYLVSGMPSQMTQVLVNMLNNSFDALIGQSDSWVKVSVFTRKEKIIIQLTDSGNGIANHDAHKIFQPFYTTKKVGQGTGLGLSVSKGIIESHGGDVTLDPNCHNTRFVITLPGSTAEIMQNSKVANE